jgi:hypothetical protein
MALKATIAVPAYGTQVTLPDMYVRVSSVSGTKSLVSMSVTLSADAQAISVHSMGFTFVPDLAGPNFIAQAYLHLKTLPEFAGATDC